MKVKDISINPSYTEESSDYVNSDIEISNTKTNIADDSNDSLTYDRDNDSMSSLSFIQVGDKRLKTNKSKQIDNVRLAECLDYLHRMVGRKDKEDIFGLPVTDDIAPGYSTIIKNPMDLSTMRKKIDSHIYNSIVEYRVIFL